MGKIKYIQDIRNFFKKNPVVDINSLKKFISYKKGSRNYIYLLISNMLKKGEIKKIARGYYSVYEDPILLVYCLKPAYIGLQSALSIHNLWEQETIPIVITARKIRQGMRAVNKNNVLIHRIAPKYLLGIDYIKENSFYIPVSDIEKTFIDMIYFKQKMDKTLLKVIRKKIDEKKLKEYLKKYPKLISGRVLSALND